MSRETYRVRPEAISRRPGVWSADCLRKTTSLLQHAQGWLYTSRVALSIMLWLTGLLK